MTNSKIQQPRWKFNLASIAELKSQAESLGVRIDGAEDISNLAEPVDIGNLTVPNSLAIHPMEGADGESDGRPGPLTVRKYKRFAAGGAGLIWAEAIAVVGEGRANPRQLWLNQQSKSAFAEMILEMRNIAAQKQIIVAQLTHSGRYSKPAGVAEPLILQRDPYRDGMSPEVEPNRNRLSKIADNYPLITDGYLDGLQSAYVEAARIAFEVGFDAVDIKSCHGYLINELLSCHRRKGRYGGSFANRTRFLLEVVDKIRSELGEDKMVTTRLGIYDRIPYPFGWGVDRQDYTKPDLTEPKKLIALLRDRGVKMINVTIANPYYNPHVGRPFNSPIAGGYQEPEHPLVGAARLIDLAGEIQKEFPDLAIVGTGYSWLRQLMPNVAAAVKGAGKAKIIGAGRLALAYPDFAKDILKSGRLDVNKVCIGCSGCTQLMRDGQTAGCVVRDNRIYGPIFKHGRLGDRENLCRLALNCSQCQEPSCQSACPASVDIPGFIRQFLDGDERAAFETIRKTNVLPEVCAWLCPVEQQCQGNCLQKFIGDGPIPIADIQRYLARQANKNGWSKVNLPEKSTGKKVAIIGAGPAGISAAVVLLEAGHSVTVFDRGGQPGGTIESVIPPERQSESLKSEVSAIFKDVSEERLTLKFKTALSEEVNVDAIMADGFDAVFIGMGLPEAISSFNEPMDGLYDALEFLSLVKKGEKLGVKGKQVAVIGGGNTAMDAVVSAKQAGACDVYLIYRRSFAEMPVWEAERDLALDQGVHFIILTQQLGYVCEDNKLTGIRLCPTRLGEVDADVRRRPVAIEASAYTLEMDIVVEAIGQRIGEGVCDILGGVELQNGLIKTRGDSFETSKAKVFAGGDIVRGASTVVAAVADGMKAGGEIDDLLKRDS